MQGTVLSYPIPLYANVPIQPQNYMPSRFVISALTFSQQTTVTTTLPMNYVVGQQVRFLIPTANGAKKLNERTGYVIALLSTTQFIVDIVSAGFDPFITTSNPNQPQIIAIGDINSGYINDNGSINLGTGVLGAFKNISPQ